MEESVTPHEISFLPADRAALDLLFTASYEELRRLASTVRRRDPAATLSPTTLVNEAWIRLAQTPAVANYSALHFKRIAARAMRQILVGAARRRYAGKRDPGLTVVFDEALSPTPANDSQIIALDAALDQLHQLSPRQALTVEGRFFGGLAVDEIASLAGVSEATVLRDWRVARAWLAQELVHGL